MPTHIIRTRIPPEAVSGPKFVEKPDIFETPDGESATKVALLVRSYGHGATETWVATPWDRFVELAKDVAK